MSSLYLKQKKNILKYQKNSKKYKEYKKKYDKQYYQKHKEYGSFRANKCRLYEIYDYNIAKNKLRKYLMKLKNKGVDISYFLTKLDYKGK